jgi:formylglycine-generating enzyme required for sulfatase activity
MKKISIVTFFILANGVNLLATDIKVTNVIVNGNVRDEANPVTAWMTVSWKNAWRTDKNYDAAWVFFKLNTGDENRSSAHGYVKQTGLSVIHNYLNNNVGPAFFVPADQAGIMVFPDKKYRGDVSWRIKLELDMKKIKNLDPNGLAHAFAYAIEMVHIPQGQFYAGEADTTSHRSLGSLYEYGTNDYYKVNSEAAIVVGTEKGNLYYNDDGQPQYRGDRKGPVPPVFPKGYNAFYIMKYEVSQGNYVSFLNNIGDYFSRNRAVFGGKNYYKQRGSISLEDGRYKTNDPNRPANFLSWDDDAAFADWAALRPMTELEFEKACRGPVKPVFSGSFPWGNNSREKLSRYYNQDGDLVMEGSLSEKDLSDANLEFFGASYYWVMDLSGSVWDRCVSLGDEKGRTFEGTHGDGRLSGYSGDATNPDWPKVDGKGGISYRGGGYYTAGMVGAPAGEVSQRRFGAWAEGPRDIAYGFRAVRSAK